MKSFMKKFFLALLVILLAVGVFNYKNIMLFFGKGNVSLHDSDSTIKTLSTNPNYTDSNVSAEGGKNVLTTKSVDKTTDIKVVSNGSKVENVQIVVDASTMNENNIKDQLTKNLEPVLAATTPDYKAIELWAAKEGAQQVLQSGQKTFTIKQTFGDVVIEATGDATTGKVQINIVNSGK